MTKSLFPSVSSFSLWSCVIEFDYVYVCVNHAKRALLVFWTASTYLWTQVPTLLTSLEPKIL